MKAQLHPGRLILLLPQEKNVSERKVILKYAENNKKEITLPLAENKIDSWRCLKIPEEFAGQFITVETEKSSSMLEAAHLVSSEEFALLRREKESGIHRIVPFGSDMRIRNIYREGKTWQFTFFDGKDSDETEAVISSDNGVFFHSDISRPVSGEVCIIEENCKYACGDVCQSFLVPHADGESLVFSLCSSGDKNTEPYFALPSLMREGSICNPHPQLCQLRVWERKWKTAGESVRLPLRFSLKPSLWPNISIEQADKTTDDVRASAFEAKIIWKGSLSRLSLELPWSSVKLDLCDSVLKCDNHVFPLKNQENVNSLHLIFDAVSTEVFYAGKQYAVTVRNGRKTSRYSVDNDVSGNLEKCALDICEMPEIEVKSECAEGTNIDINLYGLHDNEYSIQALQLLKDSVKQDSRLIYECNEFSVYSDRIEDKYYDLTVAQVLSEDVVVSPTRVIEEFQWRDTPFGDMTRVVNRSDIGFTSPDTCRFPKLRTSVASLNAAWNIAVSVFAQCSQEQYAMPGQEDMWSAGLFQGKGEGFGVWLRDTTHIALRGGCLIDPETCLRTIKYAASRGFDNGSDGPAMCIVGIWDYYLATGDKSAIFSMLPQLLDNIKQIDELYDSKAELVRAAQSTSNDAFPEPENGGFALGSECYYMKAYDNMAQIGELVGYDNNATEQWRHKGELIKKHIQERYWNDVFGFYTSGPIGSEAYENGVWESSGEEAAIWDKFGIATSAQRRSVLNSLKKTALSPYGITLFPCRKERNHYVGTIWAVWQAGFAASAAKEGDSELLLQIIAQQIRNAVLHKSFYEVLESDSGKSWRWPGQLWHASGFVSLVFYGLLGISYDTNGMSFSPCIPEAFSGLRLECLKYRNSVLDIVTEGYGTKAQIFLDGLECESIPTDITGRHRVKIITT